jgi:hypothetical protein
MNSAGSLASPAPAPEFIASSSHQEGSGYPIEAPGARASKIMGILSLLFSFLLFPVGLVLAILAILKHKKAAQAYAEAPHRYQRVSKTGYVTAIISLALLSILAIIAIISASAIPALARAKDKAKDKAVINQLNAKIADIVVESDRLVEAGVTPENLPDVLTKKLGEFPKDPNPWNPGEPAYAYTVQVLDAGEASQVENLAIEQARVEGQSVFIVTFPANQGGQGFVAGAARIHAPMNGSKVVSKVVSLDLPAPKVQPTMPDPLQKEAEQAKVAAERDQAIQQLEEARSRQAELERQKLELEREKASQKQAVKGSTTERDSEFPRVDHYAPLVTPARALQAKWELNREHIVRLKAFVGEDGRVLKVVIMEGVEGGYGFNEAATECVTKSTFHPAVRDGKPIHAWSKLINCTFKAKVP